MSPVIVWFRRNLRLIDNASLRAAADTGAPVIPVYVSDALDTGGAARWWLHHSLSALRSDLQDLGVDLVIRSGDPAQVLPELVRTAGADRVYLTRRYEPEARLQEQAVRNALGRVAELHVHDDYLLRRPGEVQSKTGGSYKVFTPFYRAAAAIGDPAAPQPAPSRLPAFATALRSDPLDALGLLPTGPDWASGLRDTWTPGESGGLGRLDAIAERVGGYADERDRPDLDTTSRLSPHLHFGEVSPRQVWHAVKLGESAASATGAEAFLRQLYWRDFSWHLLFNYPDLPDSPLRGEFAAFPWSDDDDLLRAWQRGRTGFPIVDAGMRQLWATGWMHNRVRMIVASLLVKNLMIPWQRGADWFLDTLVDADLANNSAGWQWVAGCGTDAAPYFRIFNPVLQSKKFDPDGDYIRRWVPELGDLQRAAIHEPWKADGLALRTANVTLGNDYPYPVVDLGESRQRALDAYQQIRA